MEGTKHERHAHVALNMSTIPKDLRAALQLRNVSVVNWNIELIGGAVFFVLRKICHFSDLNFSQFGTEDFSPSSIESLFPWDARFFKGEE